MKIDTKRDTASNLSQQKAITIVSEIDGGNLIKNNIIDIRMRNQTFYFHLFPKLFVDLFLRQWT